MCVCVFVCVCVCVCVCAERGARISPQPLADALSKNAEGVLKEMIDVQGSKVDIGGYYKVDEQKAAKAMRPSATLNKLIDL